MSEIRLLNKRFKRLLHRYEKTKHEYFKLIQDDQPEANAAAAELKYYQCTNFFAAIEQLAISVWKKVCQLEVQMYESLAQNRGGQHLKDLRDKLERYKKFGEDIDETMLQSSEGFSMAYGEENCFDPVLYLMLALRICNPFFHYM